MHPTIITYPQLMVDMTLLKLICITWYENPLVSDKKSLFPNNVWVIVMCEINGGQSRGVLIYNS